MDVIVVSLKINRNFIAKITGFVKVRNIHAGLHCKIFFMLVVLLNWCMPALASIQTEPAPNHTNQSIISTPKREKTHRECVRRFRKHYVKVPLLPHAGDILPAAAYGNSWFGVSVGGLHNSVNSGVAALGEAGGVFPIGHRLGGQVQAIDGVMAHTNYFSLDGLFFLRYPLKGMVALHGKYVHTNEIYEVFYGIRSDLFLNQWTVSLEAGDLHPNFESNSFFGTASLHWYMQPNWRLDGSYLRVVSHNAIYFGNEYQLGWHALPGLSVFSGVGVGGHDLRYGFIGLRYYFGCDKPLIGRQREDMVLPSTDLNFFAQSQNLVAHHFSNNLLIFNDF